MWIEILGRVQFLRLPPTYFDNILCLHRVTSFSYNILQMTLPKKDEPLKGKLTIRVTEATESKVKLIPNYAEKLRVLIQQWLDSLESEGHNNS